MLRNTGQYYGLIKPWSESSNIFKLSRRDFVEKDKITFFLGDLFDLDEDKFFGSWKY